MEVKTIMLIVITLAPMTAMLIKFLSSDPSNLRLPTHIWPKRYNISINLFMEDEDEGPKFTFKGDVEIRVQTLVRSKFIVLHSKKLRYTVHEYWMEASPQIRPSLDRFRYDVKTERLIFEAKEYLQPGINYILHFRYTGVIRNESYGIFWNEYVDSNRQHRWIVATQFQPAEARSAFPCFDEPQFKARFSIKIVRPTSMQAHSNTRRTCSNMDGKYTTDTFALTPEMSTYTVAFLVAPFQARTDGNLSILASPEDLPLTEQSFMVGRKLIRGLGNYLELDYYELGVNKLQVAAMPKLNFRGMENWGLVLIERSSLVHNGSLSSFSQVYQMKKLLAHELSHMWFGNLVTCRWWNHIWLNEGFAAYFSYFGTAMLENETEMWESYFLVDALQNSLNMDASNDVTRLHIQSNEVTRGAFFSSISYHKGASIIRMVKHILGESGFRNSLVEYLNTFKYQTVIPEDLYKIWSKYWPREHLSHLEGFFQSFIEQTGFPLVTVNVASSNRSFEMTQQRFTIKSNKLHDDSPIYTLPITFTTNLDTNFENTAPLHFLSSAEDMIKFPLDSSRLNWLILNVQSIGYYRVNYNIENWHGISDALHAPNFSGIHLLNRMQIIDDAYHLFCNRDMGSELVLELFSYLRAETEFMPWKIALRGLSNILWHSSLSNQQTDKYVRDIITNVYNEISFEPKYHDGPEDDYNREEIVHWACKYGAPSCITKTKYYFEHIEELETLPKYLHYIIFCTILRENGESAYERIIEFYHNPAFNVEKAVLLNALGCVKEPTLVERHFWNIINIPSSTDIKLKALKCLHTENSFNVYQIYRLVTRNYQQVVESLGNEALIAEEISQMTPFFTEYYEKQNFRNFNKKSNKVKCQKARKTLQVALEKVDQGLKCY